MLYLPVMKKVSILLLILLMLAPTFALACSCSPTMHHQISQAEISNANCCCSEQIVRQDPADLNQVSGFVFSSKSDVTSPLQVNVTSISSETKGSDFQFNQDQSPHRLSEVPLYLSNLALRF